MNKVNILSIVFAGICAFSACTDDKDPVINDLKDSEGNNISFTLNAPNSVPPSQTCTVYVTPAAKP